MILRSLLSHTPPWIDPRLIAAELEEVMESNTMSYQVSQELRRHWEYTFAKENAQFVQEHPKEFLEMYSSLAAQQSRPLQEVTYDMLDNALLNINWHEVFVLGCLRYVLEHRLPLASYSALQELGNDRDRLIFELYQEMSRSGQPFDIQVWLREQPNSDRLREECFLDDLRRRSSMVSAGRLNFQPWGSTYEGLELTTQMKHAMFEVLLLDTAFEKHHFSPMVALHFSQVWNEFNAWYTMLQSLNASLNNELHSAYFAGTKLHIKLSEYAYGLLDTLKVAEPVCTTFDDFRVSPV